jgi:hypothetical protein
MVSAYSASLVSAQDCGMVSQLMPAVELCMYRALVVELCMYRALAVELCMYRALAVELCMYRALACDATNMIKGRATKSMRHKQLWENQYLILLCKANVLKTCFW